MFTSPLRCEAGVKNESHISPLRLRCSHVEVAAAWRCDPQGVLQPTATARGCPKRGRLSRAVAAAERQNVKPHGCAMREIEGIETVVAKLEAYWPAIDAHFAEENAHFNALFHHDHDALGRVLK